MLFNESIKENMLYTKPEATDDDIYEAMRASNANDVLEILSPEGIEANVGTSGTKLSGGQKQKIALARAFIKKPILLILDEATSALDRENEAEVQKSIDILTHGENKITTVVIAHRLTTIKDADKIIVFEKGHVVEEGTHESLIELNGVYSGLVTQQEQAD